MEELDPHQERDRAIAHFFDALASLVTKVEQLLDVLIEQEQQEGSVIRKAPGA